jgi:DNA replication and repair protein RecF
MIKFLSLKDFRNYSKKDFSFSTGTTLIVGSNAAGKTNLLEAIYLLATGKSFRAELEEEMVAYNKQISNIQCLISDKERLEIILTRGEVQGSKVAKKIYKVNGVNRRMVDFVGNLKVVYFGPEDLEIIIDSPSIRRDYLDSVLEQTDREYRRANVSYKKGLRQRNKLLEQIREEGAPRSVLFFWDKLLIENGGVITQKREEYIDFINRQPEYFGKLALTYDKSIVSPERLAKYAEQEVASGISLVGPHRDDFQVSLDKRNLHSFGSRGEQRTAIFSIKLAELEFISDKSQTRPILLLDDIFSELDHEHRKHLLEIIPHQQTIITTTDFHLIEPDQVKKMAIVKL